MSWRLLLSIFVSMVSISFTIGQGSAQTANQANAQAYEWLMMAMPTGFQQSVKKTATELDLLSYTPNGQEIREATDFINVQVLRQIQGFDLELYVGELMKKFEASCETMGGEKRDVVLENGVPTLGIVFACSKRKSDGKGIASAMKVIHARTAVFIVTYNQTGPAFEANTLPVSQDTMAAWSDLLRKTVVCPAPIPNGDAAIAQMAQRCLPKNSRQGDKFELIPAVRLKASRK